MSEQNQGLLLHPLMRCFREPRDAPNTDWGSIEFGNSLSGDQCGPCRVPETGALLVSDQLSEDRRIPGCPRLKV